VLNIANAVAVARQTASLAQALNAASAGITGRRTALAFDIISNNRYLPEPIEQPLFLAKVSAIKLTFS
jgi:hypothetical protein